MSENGVDLKLQTITREATQGEQLPQMGVPHSFLTKMDLWRQFIENSITKNGGSYWINMNHLPLFHLIRVVFI